MIQIIEFPVHAEFSFWSCILNYKKKFVMGNATDTAIFIHIYTELNIRTM